MTVFNPDNVTHTFKIIPRDYADLNILSPLSIALLNEDKNVDVVVTEFTITDTCNGYLSMSFIAKLNEGESFQIKITNTDTEEIIFRGKAFATDKATQNYNING